MSEATSLDLVCLGEALVDFVAERRGQPLADAETFVRAAGGAPANVAVGAARLGLRVGFIGKVGADPFGDHLEGTLVAAGVDTTGLARDDRHRTGLAFVSLREGGEREFLFYRHPSADQRLAPDDVDEAYVRRARWLHFGTLTLADSPAREATWRAVRLAGAAGITRSLDVNLRLDAWPDPARARRAALSAVQESEVVKVSESELDFLTGDPGDVGAARLRHERLALLVVTRGRAGASYYVGEESGRVPGFAVDSLDTTGAGDAFVAGLLAGLDAAPAALVDASVAASVIRRANACGALATTKLGAIPALPTAEELAAFLSVRGE